MSSRIRRLRSELNVFDESFILKILNNELPNLHSRARNNLLDLLTNFRRFNAYRRLANATRVPLGEIPLQGFRNAERECESISSKVNKILRQYQWSPGVAFSQKDLNMDFFPQFQSQHEREQVAVWLSLAKWRVGEIELFQSCPECHRWFYAKKSHQRFCRDMCRKRYASHSPEYKQKRRIFMRKYRKQQKELGARATRTAQSRSH